MEVNSKKIIPSFKGLTIETKDDGTKHHTFYSPGSNDIRLEIVPLKLDKETGDYKPAGEPVKNITPQNRDRFLKIWTPGQNGLLYINDPSVKLAYRFINGRAPLLDEVRRIQVNGQDYNLAMDPERPDLKKARSIYHLMPDMIGPSVDEKGKPMPDRRNHFNIFVGTINDLMKVDPSIDQNRLDYIKGMGMTRILSTPVFNNGPKNSNGYWTKNPYQVDPIRGTVSDFKTLQKELFKRGMGFIADGAFVNESWEGIHLKDIEKYGKDSPFYRWFFAFDEDNPVNAPLLPDDDAKEAKANFGIKIINGPYRLEYLEGESKPEIIENPRYNSALPTKIQLFDRRYVQEKEQNNGDLIQTYDNEKFTNPNETKDFYDSVQLASFEIDPKKLDIALSKIKDDYNKIDPIIFATGNKLNWGKEFTLVQARGAVSNIDPWDGQNDILKLRFFTTKTEENMLDEEELKPLRKASAQVQDNIAQVGEYWTAETEKTLSEYTAKQLSEKLNDKPKTAENFKKAIDELAEEGKIPEESKLINTKQLQNLLVGKYSLPIAPLPESITEGIMSYPLEAIDFPDEVCSVLASPHIKKLAYKPELIGVSRYDLATKKDYEKDLKEMSAVYKKMDRVYEKDITPIIKEIIESSEILSKKMPMDDKGNFNSEEAKATFRIITSDIMKFIAAKAIANTSPTSDSLKTGEELEFDRDKLYENSFKNWENRSQASPKAEADSLVNSFSNGINKHLSIEDIENLTKYLEKKVQRLDGDTLKVSKLILNKTESGLEWRIDAARDVAKMGDVIREMEENGGEPRTANTFAENWDKVREFWGRFIDSVKKQNPKYYAIGESSNLRSVYKGVGEDEDKGNYPNLGTVEQKFLETTGFTTVSNYSYLFSSIPEMAKGMDDPFEFIKQKVFSGWDNSDFPGHTKQGPADSVLYSHVFTDNHDMMRSLHALSIDMGEFRGDIKLTPKRLKRWEGTGIAEKLEKIKDFEQNQKKYLTGIKEIFDKSFGKHDPDWWNNEEITANNDEKKWDFVIQNWNAEWVEKDERIAKEGLIKILKGEKEKLNDINEIKNLYAPAIVAADAIYTAYEKAAEGNTNAKTDNTVKQAISNLVMGKFKGKDYGNRLTQHFARRAVNHNWKDIVREAEHVNEYIDTKKLEALGDKIYKNFVTPGMEAIKAVELYKAILPGSPTMYNGEDTAETGLESEGKNVFLQNRNRVHYEWLSKQNGKDFVKDFNFELRKITTLRTGKLKKELSPLVDGQTILMKKPQGQGLAALYRYNKNTDVIAIINTSREGHKVKSQTIPYLDTTRQGELGVPGGGLEPGTIYYNALDKETDENKREKYKVRDDGKVFKIGKDGSPHNPITIDQPALILYRAKPFN